MSEIFMLVSLFAQFAQIFKLISSTITAYLSWKRSLLGIRSEHTINHLIFFRVLFEWGNHGGWPSGLQSKNVPLSLHSDRKQLFHYGPGQISVQRRMESHYCDDPSEVFGRFIFERAYLYNVKAYISATERSLPIDNTSYFISIWIHQ